MGKEQTEHRRLQISILCPLVPQEVPRARLSASARSLILPSVGLASERGEQRKGLDVAPGELITQSHVGEGFSTEGSWITEASWSGACLTPSGLKSEWEGTRVSQRGEQD